jgi:putative tryptophan/tyrosine transport system substrate-binding protein
MASCLGRRKFLATLGAGAAATWPLAARAQQSAMPVIGFLNGASQAQWRPSLAALRRGLKESGYVEGENVIIEYRWAEGQYDQLPALAADLVNRKVAVLIATGGSTSALAAKAATSTIPIVFSTGGDPVKEGLVGSLSHPGGNCTGVSLLTTALAAKRLEILREVVAKPSVIAVLLNPNSASAQPQTENVETAARAIDQPVHILRAANRRDIETAFATMVQMQVGALIVGADPFFSSQVEQFVALAARDRAATAPRATAKSASTPGGFLRVTNRPICRLCSPRRSSSYSISRPRARLV